jgi:hypothetical protein
MGVFILLIIVLAITAGMLRRELVLTLTGAIFLAAWLYCLLFTLLLALLHRQRAKTISIRLSPEKFAAGGSVQVMYSDKNSRRIFQLPGIIVRCKISLATRDGRSVMCEFKPGASSESFTVEKRGAYFSDYDEFTIFDTLGFFYFAYRIGTRMLRLKAGPQRAQEALPVKAQGGDTDRYDTVTYERTDNLIESRPYVPGDDPRRINWKLYGHGGELFVREGEREPPPHSNLTILIDTQYDSLYTVKSALYAVDLLCENALAAACGIKEINVEIGFTGQVEKAVLSSAELGFFLSYPWAIHVSSKSAELPQVSADRGIVIFALPRLYAEDSALERFLIKNVNRPIELMFIYGKAPNFAQLAEAAEVCAGFYNKRPGIRAQIVGIE